MSPGGWSPETMPKIEKDLFESKDTWVGPCDYKVNDPPKISKPDHVKKKFKDIP